ncbi:MAG TPA: DUF480 domain-containing protein [Phycisphaerales bacterium]|nr:DUF480 domain-containing protein [Phycisphaerales bacterium]
MIELKADECRVLGVMVEKAHTVPGQYPLTLNALTSGCNQKNNRHPVVEWDEERVYDALDSLRAKRLVNEVILTGSRVAKFRHNAREVLGVDTAQLVVLAELLLRGPRSLGDMRQNASRMHPLESLDSTRAVLESLGAPARAEPLVKEVPPPPGGRARLWVQLLCPGLHPIGASTEPASGAPSEQAPRSADPSLADRVRVLETEVDRLRTGLRQLAERVGEADPLA